MTMTERFQDEGEKRFVYRSGLATGHVIISRNLAPATEPNIAQSLQTVFRSMEEAERKA